MKCELKSREASSFRLLSRSCSSESVEGELIIPDTLEDMLRIISCRRQCRIREKSVEQDKVVIRGEIDVTVLYVPEGGGGVRAVGMSLPFENSFEAGGADSTAVSHAHIVEASAEAKMMNPRKISVRASVVMEQSCYKFTVLSWSEPPDPAPDKLYFRTREIGCERISLAAEKLLSVEEEIDVPEELKGAEFVRAFSCIRIDSNEIVGTKLVIHGTIELEALYLADGVPKSNTITLPFSQLFNLSEDCNEPKITSLPMITGQYIEATEEKLSVDVRAVVQMTCIEKMSICFIDDAYSCTGELNVENCELELISSASESRQSAQLKLNYTSDYGVSSVELCTVSAAAPEQGEGEILIPLTADVIYIDNENELRSCRLRGKAHVETKAKAPDEAIVESAAGYASGSADSLSVDISAAVSCRYKEITSVSIISEADLAEESGREQAAAVYLCRCEDGDLWSTAKKYRSDEALIRQLNGIEDECPRDRLLLIPMV